MADKTKVMEAIKSRKGVAPKKGAVLIGIMSKLTAKRESAKEDRGEKSEGSKEKVKDGAGGWAGDIATKVSDTAKGIMKKVSDYRARSYAKDKAVDDDKKKKWQESISNPDDFIPVGK
jgi:gas vesicle protein